MSGQQSCESVNDIKASMETFNRQVDMFNTQNPNVCANYGIGGNFYGNAISDTHSLIDVNSALMGYNNTQTKDGSVGPNPLLKDPTDMTCDSGEEGQALDTENLCILNKDGNCTNPGLAGNSSKCQAPQEKLRGCEGMLTPESSRFTAPICQYRGMTIDRFEYWNDANHNPELKFPTGMYTNVSTRTQTKTMQENKKKAKESFKNAITQKSNQLLAQETERQRNEIKALVAKEQETMQRELFRKVHADRAHLMAKIEENNRAAREENQKEALQRIARIQEEKAKNEAKLQKEAEAQMMELVRANAKIAKEEAANRAKQLADELELKRKKLAMLNSAKFRKQLDSQAESALGEATKLIADGQAWNNEQVYKVIADAATVQPYFGMNNLSNAPNPALNNL